MTKYEEILALRQELKRPSVFHHNQIQLRMLLWHITIRTSEAFKRFMDIVLAIFAIIAGSPVFLLTALLVKLTSPGPIIFSQVRVGKHGRHFKFYKFRSMYIDAEARKAELMKHNESGDGVIFKMKRDPRITPIGRFIRKFSIDELPQLFNVLLGDMSLVGPRPPLPREVAQYTPYQMHRLDVKTGLACYHECQGRSNAKDFDEWVESDLRYIRERGMLTDLKIIYWTARVVITGKGAV
jgi:lipopolysaccharide/colanic/teichoic acid biosynthesis glycosyltransferase